MARKRKQPRKIADIKLTAEERDILSEGFNSEFFKIIREKILPQRRIQLALTIAEADQEMQDVWYHRGMIYMCQWLPKWLSGETEKVDNVDYNNDDEDPDAEDDTP